MEFSVFVTLKCFLMVRNYSTTTFHGKILRVIIIIDVTKVVIEALCTFFHDICLL